MYFYIPMMHIFLSIISLLCASLSFAGKNIAPYDYEHEHPHSPSLDKTRHLGFFDPHVPVEVKIKPAWVNLPEEYNAPQVLYTYEDRLFLNFLSPKILEQLSKAEIRALLSHLSKIKVKIKLLDKAGHSSRWDRTNAASALILMTGAFCEESLFAKMAALAPEAVLPEFKGHTLALLGQTVAAQILVNMMYEFEHSSASQIAKSAAQLAQIYLAYWASKNADKLNYYLFNLLVQIEKEVNKTDKVFAEKQVGILLGSILAGTLNHADKIKSVDERRIWVINSVSNIVWAGTTFLGVTPIGGPVAMAVAGSISLGTVFASSFYSEFGQRRDYVPNIREIQGYIEMALLQSAEHQDHKQKLETVAALEWMRAAIHINGLSN